MFGAGVGGYEGSSWREPLQCDLQLAVDWNRPDLAAKIFLQDFAKVRGNVGGGGGVGDMKVVAGKNHYRVIYSWQWTGTDLT